MTPRTARRLLRNLSREVIEHERIKTSQAKAKAVKPEVEKLITLAKGGSLHARRQALSALGQDRFLVHKLFEEIAPALRGAPGRLHADRQARPAAVGLDRDGLPRAGLATRSLASRRERHPAHDLLRRNAVRGLGGAARPAHDAGRARGGAGAGPPAARTARRRRPDRRRSARLGPGGELRNGRRSPGRARATDQLDAAAGDRRAGGPARARRLRRTAGRPLTDLLLLGDRGSGSPPAPAGPRPLVALPGGHRCPRSMRLAAPRHP